MASSSSTISSPKYDVFLSFRGADTRNNFTSHLYNALRQEGVNVFMDKELKRGEEISSTLFLMIEASQVSIVIFSPNYAASKFCLDELVKILECKASKQQVVLPVFYRVDPFEVEKLTGKYGKCISRHEAQYKGFKRLFLSRKSIEEKLEKVKKWKSALAETADLAGWDLRNRDEAEIIREIIERVLQKVESSPLEGGLVLDVLPSSKELFPEKRLVGVNFEINKGDICAWLTADDVSSIGIWGMGGVGKTTLMIHIYNKLIEKQEVSDQLYWVTVSEDFGVHKLQNLIAKEVGLDFRIEDDVMKRAARLLKVLSSKDKFVLILDDLWNYFDAEELGIPIKAKGCKLIITTRILHVCTQMNLQKIKKIEPLSEEEAWYLFNEKLGHDLAVNVEMIAKSIVRECAGLPLGIVTIAGSMRGVDDIHEWNNALTELERSELRPEDMGDKVFRILRFSYTRLHNWALQQCILYCALFPEDHKINREELIELLVVEGIIEQRMSSQMNFDKGHVILNKLVKVSLLEDVRGEGGVRYIKMHDLIRDMAIQITRESSQSIIEAGRQLKNMPVEKYWTSNIVRVSLMCNDINEIPSHYSPTCSSLSTLLLSENVKLKSIPESFFCQFHGLKILDLSSTGIEKLPESVGCLANLRALLLRVCRDLRSMPSLEKLVSLEILDLPSCWALQELPKGLELLSNLTFLNLHDSVVYSIAKAEELAELKELESLNCSFRHFEEFSEYVRLISKNQKQPINYFYSVGDERMQKLNECTGRPHTREVGIFGCQINRELFIIKDQQILRMKDVSIFKGNGFCFKTSSGSYESELKDESTPSTSIQLLPSATTFSRLKRFIISRCDRIKSLCTSTLFFNFQNLQDIVVEDCSEMEEIIAAEDSNSFHDLTETLHFNLPKLRSFTLEKLPILEKICSKKIVCDSLQQFAVKDCESLRNIPISLPLPSLQTLRVQPKEWWYSVQWGNRRQKDILLPEF